MLHLIKTYELGNTIYFECLYRDIDGYLTDPTSAAWTIKDLQGVTVDSGGLSKKSTGIWYFFWTSDTVGDYLLTFSGLIDDNPVTIRCQFKIAETRLK